MSNESKIYNFFLLITKIVSEKMGISEVQMTAKSNQSDSEAHGLSPITSRQVESLNQPSSFKKFKPEAHIKASRQETQSSNHILEEETHLNEYFKSLLNQQMNPLLINPIINNNATPWGTHPVENLFFKNRCMANPMGHQPYLAKNLIPSESLMYSQAGRMMQQESLRSLGCFLKMSPMHSNHAAWIGN